jgi:hypothetical protein
MPHPFTPDEFFDVFRRYNEAIWPAQWGLAALAIIAVMLALRHESRASRWVSVLLAVLWFWMAVVYHLAFFADLSRIGIVFGLAFGVQGALFSWLAVRPHPTSYRARSSLALVVGAALIAYAIIIYPALGYHWGHRYPANPTFGVPCPTTIFTLGLIVWASRSIPRRLAIVPLAWAVVGTSAALNLGVLEDFGLPAAAVLTGWMLVAGRHAAISSGRRPAPATR